MASTALQKLYFAIGLRDNTKGGLASLQRSIDRTCRLVKNNFEGIKAGALSAAGAGMTMYQMVNPAVDFNRAMGEVASLDVGQDALHALQTSAKQFAMQYGGTAAEVVRASYDIQSAIAGLAGKELGAFTVASATLAKATKADTATITSYVGTMYGIFKQQADGMGKAAWVEQLAGQTATAVQMFKTTGMEMSSAFTALGANATAAGISASEQMTVLGMLQSTMGGSEAGTKYKAFLAGIGSAQKTLGLSFTDKSGNMLGVSAILEKIKGKFGETLDVAEGDLLKKAFGSDEAVSMIKQLLSDTSGLKNNIDALGKVQGMEKARAMAAKMTDVWGRLGGAFNVVSVSFSQSFLPVLENVVDGIVGVLTYVQSLMALAPTLTRYIGLGVMAMMSMGVVMGILAALWAMNKLALLGIKGPFMFTLSLIKGLTIGFFKLAAAMLVNPIFWIVLGIVALIAAVVLLVMYWDNLKAAFMDSTWGAVIIGVVQDICAWWERLTTALSNGDWANALLEIINMILAPLRAVVDVWIWIGNKLGSAMQVGVTPALSSVGTAPVFSNTVSTVSPAHISSLEAPRTLDMPAGSVGATIASSVSKSNARITNMGGVNIYPQQMLGAGELEEQAALNW